MESLKFRTKIALCEYFWTATLKTIAIFEIIALELVKLKLLVQNDNFASSSLKQTIWEV